MIIVHTTYSVAETFEKIQNAFSHNNSQNNYHYGKEGNGYFFSPSKNNSFVIVPEWVSKTRKYFPYTSISADMDEIESGTRIIIHSKRSNLFIKIQFLLIGLFIFFYLMPIKYIFSENFTFSGTLSLIKNSFSVFDFLLLGFLIYSIIISWQVYADKMNIINGIIHPVNGTVQSDKKKVLNLK